MPIHTHIFKADVIQRTLCRPYGEGLLLHSTDWPPHHTNTSSMLSLDGVIYTHSRTLTHRHTLLLPANLHPAAVRTSCDWFVPSVSTSAHILTRPRARTASGINSPCVWISIQFGSPLCLLLCNAKASCSFPCCLHRTVLHMHACTAAMEYYS